MKTCTKCGEAKPPDAFYRQKGCRDGRRPECKACSDDRIARCHAAKPELRKLYSDRTRARYGKLYEARRQQVRRTDPNEAERQRGVRRAWYARNSDRLLAYARAWYREHPQVALLNVHRRHARLRGGGGTLTKADWEDVLGRLGTRCLRCGSDAPVTIDHIVPISAGGRHEKANVQPLCKRCNAVKFNRTWDFRLEVAQC